MSGSPVDAGIEAAVDAGGPQHDASTPPPADGSTGDEDSGPTLAYDGTTGKPCSTDADCQPPGGPGYTQCSTTVFEGAGPYFPTPVCMMATCQPGSGDSVQYCDGPPDDPTSPGICVSIYGGLAGDGLSNTEPGVCLPQCAFGGGGAPSGCAGKDVCNAYVIGALTTEGPIGLGYCFGGCQKNADCPAGSKCQTDEGICVSAAPAMPTKPDGTACTTTDDTLQTCNCSFGLSSNGYCTSFCIAGDGGCPSGWVCETYEPAAAFPAPTAGLGGVCAPACAGDAGVDAGGTCPAGSKCETTYAAGPDCIPQ